jgi:hypothetical protein
MRVQVGPTGLDNRLTDVGENVTTNLEPAPVGNERALTHGAYSAPRLGKRTGEIVDELRPLLPVADECDEPALRLLALSLARLERAAEALELKTKPSELARLEQDARGWVNSSVRLADALGMTPTSRARLGLTLVRAREVVNGGQDLSRLSPTELAQLRQLLAKAEAA